VTSIERAKAYLESRARKLALAAVPLAIAAAGVMPAKAGNIQLNVGGSATYTAKGAGCCAEGTTASSNLPAYNNLIGATLSGSITSFISGSGIDTLTWDYSNTASGVPGVASVPIFWDFILLPATLADTVSWELDVNFNGGAVTNTFSGSGLSGSSSYEIISSNYATQPTVINLPGTLTSYEVILTAAFNHGASESGSDSVNIPGGASIDLNSASVTPEPGTWTLLLTGSGAILWLGRRRKANGPNS